MITYAAIAKDVRASLDAEGSDYYRDDLDIVPALNKAQDYLMAIIMPKMGAKKFNEENFKGIIATRIFQPSIYSRIYIDQVISSWGIMSVMVNPVVAIPPATSSTFTPVAVPNADQSAMLANYIYVSGGASCRRLTSQEWASNQGNPLLDSYVPTAAELAQATAEGITPNLNYGYLSAIDNLSTIDAAMPYEITIRPYITSTTPVAVTYAKYPSRVDPVLLNNLDWSPVFQQLLVQGTLKFIAEKIGDKTTIYEIQKQDIDTIILNQS